MLRGNQGCRGVRCRGRGGASAAKGGGWALGACPRSSGCLRLLTQEGSPHP